MSRLIVIGNGTLAMDCLAMLHDRPAAEIVLVVYDQRERSIGGGVAAWCKNHSVAVLPVEKNINAPEVLQGITALEPDLIFNINSFFIFRDELLAVAKGGMVNFHNAPLPRFRGVHSPSWAIITGATDYGVTWHFIDKGIDTGDIIAQRPVEISDDETALSLTIKCMLAGKALFAEFIDDLLAGDFTRTPQSGPGSYYSLRDTPNGGYIDFSDDCKIIDRVVRGLDFGPATNTFVHAKTRFRERDFIVSRVSCRPQAATKPPGTALSTDAGRLEVAAGDGIVSIEDVRSADGEPLTVSGLIDKLGIRPNDRLENVRVS
ncbi:MAG: hypothetical protein H0W33_00035 [Gammaproteobacteria bacterium]|nr:hypothetical protein [Gammaproteobacteria bacterium]